MPEQVSKEETDRWHRRFGVAANNRAWTLSERIALVAEEKTELLFAAYAAAYHWSTIGSEAQLARAELLLGRVHSILGQANLAARFARSAFKSITSRDGAAWELALAHAVMADAASVSGDLVTHRHHYLKARELSETLTDREEREVFFATFDRLAPPSADH